jgi:hypothetical protein
LDSLIDGLKLEQSKAKGLTDAQSSVTPRSAVQIKSNSSNMVVPQAIKNQQESTASKGFTGNNSTSTLKPRDSNLQSGYNKAHVNLEQLLQSLPISTTAAKANDSKRNSSTVNAICEYCNEIVVQGESYILALGRLFHTEHFKCRQCSNLIDNNLYYERNNGIVCQKCFNDDRLALQQEDGLVCAYCNQSIKGVCYLHNLLRQK